MGAGDLMPSGYHRRKADPRAAKRLKEGGKKADLIKTIRETHHKQNEVPEAEKALEKDLEQIDNPHS